MSPTPVLDYDATIPEGAGDGTPVAVLLHGRGSHKGDLQTMAPVLPSDWAIVTPQAPNPGEAWGYGPGWAWYRYVGQDEVVVETLEDSLAKLETFLDDLPGLLGFTPGLIVLGGFSQGGAMSMAYALSRPGSVMAALNFSGFLAASVKLPSGAAAAEATPIFWGHGLSDEAIPIELALRGRARLSEAGVPFTAKDYGIGHWIVPGEIHDAIAMVAEIRERDSRIR